MLRSREAGSRGYFPQLDKQAARLLKSTRFRFKGGFGGVARFAGEPRDDEEMERPENEVEIESGKGKGVRGGTSGGDSGVALQVARLTKALDQATDLVHEVLTHGIIDEDLRTELVQWRQRAEELIDQ